MNARQNQADQCPASDVIGYADTCSVPADFWSYGPVEIPPPPDSIKPPPNAAFTSFAQLVSTPGGGEFRCPADGAISYNDECVVQQPNDVWKMATKPQKDSGIKLQMEFDAKNSCPYGRIQDHEFMDGHQGNATLLAIWQDLNKASNDDWIDYIEAKVEAVLDSNAKNFKSTWGLDFYEFSKIAGSDVDYKTYNDSGNKRRSTDLAVRQNEGTGNFLRALGNSKDLFVGTVCFVGLVASESRVVSLAAEALLTVTSNINDRLLHGRDRWKHDCWELLESRPFADTHVRGFSWYVSVRPEHNAVIQLTRFRRLDFEQFEDQLASRTSNYVNCE